MVTYNVLGVFVLSPETKFCECEMTREAVKYKFRFILKMLILKSLKAVAR